MMMLLMGTKRASVCVSVCLISGGAIAQLRFSLLAFTFSGKSPSENQLRVDRSFSAIDSGRIHTHTCRALGARKKGKTRGNKQKGVSVRHERKKEAMHVITKGSLEVT